jgi:hypothetical protein
MRRILMCVLLAGCGGGSGTTIDGGGGGIADADPNRPDAGPYADKWVPLVVGARWTYMIHDGQTNADGTGDDVVEAFEPVGPMNASQMAFRLNEARIVGSNLHWEADVGTAIVKYREEAFGAGAVLETDEYYDPYLFRVDYTPAHLVKGTTFSQTYTETKIQNGSMSSKSKLSYWKVIDPAETVTVPAGTFTALHLQHTGASAGTAVKEYWFVQGVGKVKEVVATTGDHQELVSFSLPSP